MAVVAWTGTILVNPKKEKQDVERVVTENFQLKGTPRVLSYGFYFGGDLPVPLYTIMIQIPGEDLSRFCIQRLNAPDFKWPEDFADNYRATYTPQIVFDQKEVFVWYQCSPICFLMGMETSGPRKQQREKDAERIGPNGCKQTS